MGLNVSTKMSFQLENKENLKNTAKSILARGGASAETTSKIIEKALFDNNQNVKDLYTNPQMNIIKASTQISLNKSLNETLKYLKSQSNQKKIKKVVFGELWNILETNNESFDENKYDSDLYNIQIDLNAKNIFAA